MIDISISLMDNNKGISRRMMLNRSYVLLLSIVAGITDCDANSVLKVMMRLARLVT